MKYGLSYEELMKSKEVVHKHNKRTKVDQNRW